jgi:SNF2 family DNA or RNA helicase
LVAGTVSADQRQALAAGQQSETVVIHHIITKDTIDEMVMKALDQKNLTQSALMDAVRAQLRR